MGFNKRNESYLREFGQSSEETGRIFDVLDHLHSTNDIVLTTMI
jgi:hypothetical protein